MAFKLKLSEETRHRIAQEKAEARRVFGLADRWLAEYLLTNARQLQTALRGAGWTAYDQVYDTVFAWDVVPEVAKRLGAVRFLPMERQRADIVRLSDSDLRLRASHCVSNMGSLATSSLLARRPEQGNALVFALDRLAPPAAEEPHVRRLAELARYRGIAFNGYWTVCFLDP